MCLVPVFSTCRQAIKKHQQSKTQHGTQNCSSIDFLYWCQWRCKHPVTLLIKVTTSRHGIVILGFVVACFAVLCMWLDLTLDSTGLYLVPWATSHMGCHPKQTNNHKKLGQVRSLPKQQAVTSMNQSTFHFIDSPVMHWSVDDSLYSRFKKWKLKCENTLEVELAIFILLDARKCNTLSRCSGDQELKMYEAWCLDCTDISKEMLSTKWEEIYKP